MPFAIALLQKSPCSFLKQPCFFSHIDFLFVCRCCFCIQFYFPENSSGLSTPPIFLWVKASSPPDISWHIFHVFQDNFFFIFIIGKQMSFSHVSLWCWAVSQSCCYKYSYPVFPCSDQENIENINICLSPSDRRFY